MPTQPEYAPIGHLVESLDNYAKHGRAVGGFLSAVLENNLSRPSPEEIYRLAVISRLSCSMSITICQPTATARPRSLPRTVPSLQGFGSMPKIILYSVSRTPKHLSTSTAKWDVQMRRSPISFKTKRQAVRIAEMLLRSNPAVRSKKVSIL